MIDRFRTTNRNARILLLAAAMTVGGCASAQEGTPAVAGCWYFERDAAADALRLPWGVRLAEAPLEGWPVIASRGDVHLATTLQSEGETDHPFGYWLALPSDSIEIGYPAGGGIVLTVAPTAEVDWLRGSALLAGDVLPPNAPRPSPTRVALVRASCPDAG